MKKIFLTSLFLTVVSLIFAAKVYQGPMVTTQSDGTSLIVQKHGDEHFSYTTTSDKVLLYNDGGNFYIAKVDNYSGALTSTGILAHNPGLRSAEEAEAITNQNTEAFYNSQDTSTSRAKMLTSIFSNSLLCPHTGSPKIVVILAQFTDTVFHEKDPNATFDKYFNQTGSFDANDELHLSNNHGSVAQYFKDISGGLFTPQFDVYGPVTLSKGTSYYGDGDTDAHWTQVVSEACNLADPEIDFSKYDSNNDGYVDDVIVIYAGYTASQTTYSYFLNCETQVGSSLGTFDGKTVATYNISCELDYSPEKTIKDKTYYVNGIGLTTHEFSHSLGLPDMYSSLYTNNNQEMEYWDLMDGGEYTGNDGGYCPTPYTPWESEVMGWSKLDTLKSAQNVTLTPINAGGKAYRILNDANSNEYYMVENVQQTGWHSAADNHGMLIYHVNYVESAFQVGSFPNNVQGKPKMTIFPADGVLLSSYQIDHKTITNTTYHNSMAGDPFPGTSGTTSFTDTTTIVKSIVYNGSTGLMSKPITDIAESAEGIITFKFMGGTTGIEENIIDNTKKGDNRIYSINGMYMGTDVTLLPNGIYIRNGKKFVK